jgi:dipeptidyl aminopeptidase/acylaminoacyl peptidase
MFFFHGVSDSLVPIRSPQRMVELLASSGVTAEMHTIEGRGHIAAVFDSEARDRAIAFADRHLKQTGSKRPAARKKGGATDGH